MFTCSLLEALLSELDLTLALALLKKLLLKLQSWQVADLNCVSKHKIAIIFFVQRPSFRYCSQQIWSSSVSRCVGANVWSFEHCRCQPHENRQRHQVLGIRSAMRSGRALSPRKRAWIVDHAWYLLETLLLSSPNFFQCKSRQSKSYAMWGHHNGRCPSHGQSRCRDHWRKQRPFRVERFQAAYRVERTAFGQATFWQFQRFYDQLRRRNRSQPRQDTQASPWVSHACHRSQPAYWLR